MATMPATIRTAFVEGERRTLEVRPERIDPARLEAGLAPAVEAECVDIFQHPTHRARHYRLATFAITAISAIRDATVQINTPDDADDAATLRQIAEDLLVSDEFAIGASEVVR